MKGLGSTAGRPRPSADRFRNSAHRKTCTCAGSRGKICSGGKKSGRVLVVCYKEIYAVFNGGGGGAAAAASFFSFYVFVFRLAFVC